VKLEQKQHRVVILCNPNLHTKASAVVLLRAGVNVVGIVAARQRSAIARVRSSIKRNGIRAFVSRGLSRVLCHFLNGRRDREIYEQLYSEKEIETSIRFANVPIKLCASYGEQDVINWIRTLAPDILVVHSGTFVSRSVRELAKTGIVIGGHPGLTQSFRGGSSSFRAIYDKRPDDVGWTVFHLSKGIDTGDIIAQGRLTLGEGESFDTLDWRAMICIAQEQARLINELDNGNEIPRLPYGCVDASTLYWYPTLLEFLRYRLQQQRVR
jgi:folate-dependent phosphoribosylglycinamide formyltransferase PurN